jgi:hypothetical protein
MHMQVRRSKVQARASDSRFIAHTLAQHCILNVPLPRSGELRTVQAPGQLGPSTEILHVFRTLRMALQRSYDSFAARLSSDLENPRNRADPFFASGTKVAANHS